MHTTHACNERAESTWWVGSRKANFELPRVHERQPGDRCCCRYSSKQLCSYYVMIIVSSPLRADRKMNVRYTGPRCLTGATYYDRAIRGCPLLDSLLDKRCPSRAFRAVIRMHADQWRFRLGNEQNRGNHAQRSGNEDKHQVGELVFSNPGFRSTAKWSMLTCTFCASSD